jgi:threonine aldolase
MKKVNQRRDFLKQSGLIGVASMAGLPAMAFSDHKNSKSVPYVNFTRDGLDFSPEDYAKKLVEITKAKWIEIDSYSNGGVVEELEKKMANTLGKEAAVYMPTGTMANHIALRKLAGNKSRVMVQAESHIYNDSGDTAQVLSNLNLVPLNPGNTQFTLEDVKEQANRVNNGRVKTGIGAISIESPVRRNNNEVFDYAEMKKISVYARENRIGMHLDGARLFNVPAHTGKTVKEYAELFDTVYISIYKDFNAASGAILAGSTEFCKDLFHTRRMFGGSMPSAWPFAAVANEYIDSFPADYQKSLTKAEELFSSLTTDFKLEKIKNGTNVMKLHVLNSDPRETQLALLEKNIKLSNPSKDFTGFYIKINPSILRIDMKQSRLLINLFEVFLFSLPTIMRP